MKLQKLIISNFRGLKGSDNVIDFSKSNIIFLIGQNNVGKSTYLHAYEYFVSPSTKALISDFYNNDTNTPIVIEGYFLKEENDDEQEDFIGTGRSRDPEWVNKWVDSNGLIKVRKTWNSVNQAFIKETYSPENNDWQNNGFGGMETLFTKYAPTPILINAMEDESSLSDKTNKLMQDEYIKKMKVTHKREYQKALESIRVLQQAISGTEGIQNLNEKLNEKFQEIFNELTLTIRPSTDDPKLEDALKKNYTISVSKRNSDRVETFLQNGHGVIRQALFNFLTFLKNNTEGTRKEYLILFEEPELFLHPKITFKLRESLYRLAEDSPFQILCATHSPMMIDISKPHSSLIRLTKDENENTRSFQVGEDIFGRDEDTKNRVQMINRFNPHICEAFYADNVILVEGDTETIVYRHLLAKYFPDKEVFVLNTGSKNNLEFFQEVLTGFRIKHCVIHDMDTEFARNGNNNPVWTVSKNIWSKIENANSIQSGLARRYVHNANFENAHKYRLLGGKEKPLQAYKFAKRIVEIVGDEIEASNELPNCLKWLNDYLGAQSILHDQNYIEANKKTQEDIESEEQNYIDLDND